MKKLITLLTVLLAFAIFVIPSYADGPVRVKIVKQPVDVKVVNDTPISVSDVENIRNQYSYIPADGQAHPVYTVPGGCKFVLKDVFINQQNADPDAVKLYILIGDTVYHIPMNEGHNTLGTGIIYDQSEDINFISPNQPTSGYLIILSGHIQCQP